MINLGNPNNVIGVVTKIKNPVSDFIKDNIPLELIDDDKKLMILVRIQEREINLHIGWKLNM